jgi:hypothetical protein
MPERKVKKEVADAWQLKIAKTRHEYYSEKSKQLSEMVASS